MGKVCTMQSAGIGVVVVILSCGAVNFGWLMLVVISVFARSWCAGCAEGVGGQGVSAVEEE